MEKVKLLDICQPKQWKTIAVNKMKEDGLYPVYGANGKIGKHNEYNHRKPTVIITCRGNYCGNVHITEPKSYITANAMALDELEEKWDEKYIYYFLKNYHMEKVISGSVQPQITKQNLTKIEINVIPKKEQIEIVKKLDKIEQIIRQRKQQKQELNHLKEALLIEIIEVPMENEKKLLKVKLKEMCQLITKGASPHWQGFQYINDNSETLFITSENVKKGYLDLTKIKYVSNQLNERQKRSSLKKGDFLINIVDASIGRVAQFDKDVKANINQAIALVRVKEGIIENNYLLEFLNSSKAINMYQKMKNTAARANLTLKNIGDIEIIIPSIEKQKEFAKRIQKINQTLKQLEESLKHIRALEKSLMKQYFDNKG